MSGPQDPSAAASRCGPSDPSRAEALAERLFDGDLTAAERAELGEHLRADPAASRRVVETERVLRSLRAPIASPDLSGAILAEVGRRRGFVSRRDRRRVSAMRLSLAASVIGAVGFIAMIDRLAPDAVRLDQPRRPVATISDAFATDVNRTDAGAVAAGLTASVDGLITRAIGGTPRGMPLGAEAEFTRDVLWPETIDPGTIETATTAGAIASVASDDSEATRVTSAVVPGAGSRLNITAAPTGAGGGGAGAWSGVLSAIEPIGPRPAEQTGWTPAHGLDAGLVASLTGSRGGSWAALADDLFVGMPLGIELPAGLLHGRVAVGPWVADAGRPAWPAVGLHGSEPASLAQLERLLGVLRVPTVSFGAPAGTRPDVQAADGGVGEVEEPVASDGSVRDE